MALTDVTNGGAIDLGAVIDMLLARLKEHEEAATAIRAEIRDARKRLVIGRRAPSTRRTSSTRKRRAGMPANGGIGEPVANPL